MRVDEELRGILLKSVTIMEHPNGDSLHYPIDTDQAISQIKALVVGNFSKKEIHNIIMTSGVIKSPSNLNSIYITYQQAKKISKAIIAEMKEVWK